MEVVYQHDLVMICYKREENLLQVSWRNYLTSEDFMRGFRALLKLTSELEIEKWLIDARHSEELVTKNMCWSREFIGSVLEKSNLKKIARIGAGNEVQEQDILNNVNFLIQNYQLPCEIRFYKNPQKALDWLSEKTQDYSALKPEFQT
ncbi:hypothetical protein I5M27_08160 [Adhaeribacter sp. BT258]|uniref:SpoIIAA-like n=1 Tax=Adhaeribacter terrigena TaxID=2793070 RepID=A0ABS1C0M4_9BACT|nr:hypothetical protein [Adhaeribacter terrigena]MBK0402958.1 hypothetical protein [Adhaeribacter terrigena]